MEATPADGGTSQRPVVLCAQTRQPRTQSHTFERFCWHVATCSAVSVYRGAVEKLLRRSDKFLYSIAVKFLYHWPAAARTARRGGRPTDQRPAAAAAAASDPASAVTLRRRRRRRRRTAAAVACPLLQVVQPAHQSFEHGCLGRVGRVEWPRRRGGSCRRREDRRPQRAAQLGRANIARGGGAQQRTACHPPPSK